MQRISILLGALLFFVPLSVGVAQQVPPYAPQLVGTWQSSPTQRNAQGGAYEVFHFEPLGPNGEGTFVYMSRRADDSQELGGRGKYRFATNDLIESRLHLEIKFSDDSNRKHELPWYFVSKITNDSLALTATSNANVLVDLVRAR
jgi:hypothetical protein